MVTGGSDGLGYASARELLREGAAVTVSSRSHTKVADAVHRLGPNGPARSRAWPPTTGTRQRPRGSWHRRSRGGASWTDW
ncbi:SDR family NAD(P)-dependent oxidoreductase [Mycolicibacterium fortuitum]